jgi:signal transduction histidine kinase
MGVQAGAARRVLVSQPDTAVELLSSIEASSRAAVVELQRLLGLLRQAGDVDDGGPQPTLDGLVELADQVREAGLDVHLDLDADEVPPAVALSAYRIVQEALTNTLKHAGAGHRADVQVRQRPSSLEVVVVDDGHGPAGEDATGHGLLGMRERVLLHGGELKAGRRVGEPGFEVRAWLPL